MSLYTIIFFNRAHRQKSSVKILDTHLPTTSFTSRNSSWTRTRVCVWSPDRRVGTWFKTTQWSFHMFRSREARIRKMHWTYYESFYRVEIRTMRSHELFPFVKPTLVYWRVVQRNTDFRMWSIVASLYYTTTTRHVVSFKRFLSLVLWNLWLYKARTSLMHTIVATFIRVLVDWMTSHPVSTHSFPSDSMVSPGTHTFNGGSKKEPKNATSRWNFEKLFHMVIVIYF
jgi:hypothetical protein